MRIELPNNWKPRDYQEPLWKYLHNGGKRAIGIWARRHGKDDLGLHYTACALHERVGNYWHLLPQQNQARKAIWDAVNPHTGKLRIDEAFPKELRASTRAQDMLIKFKNGSTWQVIGSDNYDALVGTPPVGVIYSEWALSNPQAWSLVRPILAENGGYAIFITTPRGKNHAYNMYQMAKDEDNWFAEIVTAEETEVFTAETLESERRELIAERGEVDGQAVYEQEYLCSFTAALPGAYYQKVMADLEKAGRITRVPHDPGKTVHTGWDLGGSDACTIWFAQETPNGWSIIDYLASTGQGPDYYVKELNKKPYNYGEHLVPHDADHKQKGVVKASTYAMQLRNLGLRNVRVVPRTSSVANDINQVRRVLATCSFDKEKCADGLEGLKAYRREWDSQNKVYRDKPLHDWASDPADGFRTFAVGQPQDLWEEEEDDYDDDETRSSATGY